MFAVLRGLVPLKVFCAIGLPTAERGCPVFASFALVPLFAGCRPTSLLPRGLGSSVRSPHIPAPAGAFGGICMEPLLCTKAPHTPSFYSTSYLLVSMGMVSTPSTTPSDLTTRPDAFITTLACSMSSSSCVPPSFSVYLAFAHHAVFI
ncbi:hypothetical protein K438DRAFT_1959077 [Mycena galopus ATCC 62051]|nr:hypothetical protein K438DRAFT_1959077 [Mycena galopus ATCC 62051]